MNELKTAKMAIDADIVEAVVISSDQTNPRMSRACIDSSSSYI